MFYSYDKLNTQKYYITIISESNPGIFYSDSSNIKHKISYKLIFNNISKNKYGIEITSLNSQSREELLADNGKVIFDMDNSMNLQKNNKIAESGKSVELEMFNNNINFPNFYPADTATDIDNIYLFSNKIIHSDSISAIYNEAVNGLRDLVNISNNKDYYINEVNDREIMNFYNKSLIRITDLDNIESFVYEFYCFLKHEPIPIANGKPESIPSRIVYHRGFLIEGLYVLPYYSIQTLNDSTSKIIDDIFSFVPSSKFEQFSGNNATVTSKPMRIYNTNIIFGYGVIYSQTLSTFSTKNVIEIAGKKEKNIIPKEGLIQFDPYIRYDLKDSTVDIYFKKNNQRN
jgi:hypothetical protein